MGEGGWSQILWTFRLFWSRVLSGARSRGIKMPWKLWLLWRAKLVSTLSPCNNPVGWTSDGSYPCPVSKRSMSLTFFLVSGISKAMVFIRWPSRKWQESRKRRKWQRQLRQPQTRGLSAGVAESTESTEMTKTMGIWGANPRFPKQRALKYPCNNPVDWTSVGSSARPVSKRSMSLTKYLVWRAQEKRGVWEAEDDSLELGCPFLCYRAENPKQLKLVKCRVPDHSEKLGVE